MDDTKRYTLEEAHLHYAKSLNGKTWDLLQKGNRSKADDELLIHTAHASCYHWLYAGTGVQHQRAEWLLAHVYTELCRPDSALVHARRCLELTDEFSNQMRDFDWAYAYEGIARANALSGNIAEARKYLQMAENAGQTILGKEDKEIFFNDFNSGNWHGLR